MVTETGKCQGLISCGVTILENQEPQFTCLEYEPPLHGSAKSIDFLATSGDLKAYIDNSVRPKNTP